MQNTPRYIFHLLPNAHLDPVWLWDWREGLNEGLTTVSTVLDLMDEYPDLTFLRGEATIYQHIQRTAPKTFERILEKITQGRWDVVGGTHVQPDSNLSSTETLCRHFDASLKYFDRELGVRPNVAWQADSFGHTAGWPNILRGFGMEGFAFTRPQRSEFAMDSPAFWWECDSVDRLLCYRQHWKWYCSERCNIPEVLDETLLGASQQKWRNVGVLIGLGNHGGGPTRRHLAEIEKWGLEHGEVELRYSTLHGFFDVLRQEVDASLSMQTPTVGGEFGYCLRGCYSSVQKFKALFRQAESIVTSAETTQCMIQSAVGGTEARLDEAWEAILFNSFHDILPGTSIERAMDEQSAWVGLAIHHGHKARFEALNQLAAGIDTRVRGPSSPDAPTEVPVLVWNALPRDFSGPVEIEASLDYRPLLNYENQPDQVPFALYDEAGRVLPFQEIATEHSSMPTLAWRKRVVANFTIPSMGWRVVRLGLAPRKSIPALDKTACTGEDGVQPSIRNSDWQIGTNGKGELTIELHGHDFFAAGGNLRLLMVEDPWGSWGGMNEERESYLLDQVREEWFVTESALLESGPERSRLWTRWQGKESWVDLTFDLDRQSPWITVHGRMLWNERSARLQLVIPSTGPATCDVPGSVVQREGRGQVPVGRWFHREDETGHRIGVASDVLSDADFFSTETRLTLARASRYANDTNTPAHEKKWQPAVDCGELKFRVCLFSNGPEPDHIADHLLNPPVTLPVTPHDGPLTATGSLGELTPVTVRLLSAKCDRDGSLELRVQNRGSGLVNPKFRWGGKMHSLGPVEVQQIKTVVLPSSAFSGHWHSEKTVR